jgi:hypothetical protein
LNNFSKKRLQNQKYQPNNDRVADQGEEYEQCPNQHVKPREHNELPVAGVQEEAFAFYLGKKNFDLIFILKIYEEIFIHISKQVRNFKLIT